MGTHRGRGHFNPLPPCGGRQRYTGGLLATVDFNPLPPCGGRRDPVHAGLRGGFQSTPSVWRETQLSTSYQPQFNISIHSLRVEGDQLVSFLFPRPQNFNPLPPCGGRPLRSPICKGACRISIHSLRVEGDRQRCFAGSSVPGFQSTPSVWRETI